MNGDETYLEKEERKRFLRSGGNNDIAERSFQISPTNRIVLPGQAQRLLLIRTIARLSGIKQLSLLADEIEEYQLTIGEPENSRSYALRMTRAQYVPPEKKEGGSF